MIRRSLAAFAIALALGLGAATQVNAGGIPIQPRADIQVEVSHPSVCDAVNIHQCKEQWMVSEISQYTNNDTNTVQTSERVSLYDTLDQARDFLYRLSQEFTLSVEFHDVYKATAHTERGDYTWIDGDDSRAIDGALTFAAKNHATVTSVDVRWN